MAALLLIRGMVVQQMVRQHRIIAAWFSLQHMVSLHGFIVVRSGALWFSRWSVYMASLMMAALLNLLKVR